MHLMTARERAGILGVFIAIICRLHLIEHCLAEDRSSGRSKAKKAIGIGGKDQGIEGK